MKFHIKKIILWLKNGKKREINFEPNKVNVITGNSNTGKTAILGIIDYCFFARESTISESVINENVEWYGILIVINDKEYTIARRIPYGKAVSKDYYFSSLGEIPDVVELNNSEDSIKKLIETEYKIDQDVKIPYAGNSIVVGSKISLRYFMMFNTISGNIISNDTDVFFDKQNIPRYQEALPRIFDLVVGIETIENILKKEKKLELEKELLKLNRKKNIISSKSRDFQDELASIIKTAKEYNLIATDLDLDESMKELKECISNVKTKKSENPNGRDSLEQKKYTIERKIINLKRFISELSNYKKNLLNIDDSLKPIKFLKERHTEIIKTPILNRLIDLLSSELLVIRKECQTRTPIDNQVRDAIKNLERELSRIKINLAYLPNVNRSFENKKEKYFFLGEVKSKLDLYSSSLESPKEIEDKKIKKLTKEVGSIDFINTEEKRNLTIKLAEEIIRDYISSAGDALENYANYEPIFNYKNKALLLRKPKAVNLENVGSSSNHMFLHLFFSLAMQEVAFLNKSPFIAPFLVIDQPSRPYYGDKDKKKENLKQSDEFKIRQAFIILDEFIETRKKNAGEFQIIVFEHVPLNIFDGLKNTHLVEEFKNGNALIPLDMIQNKDNSNSLEE